jgi:ketosteroid isomerase-like protein
VSGSENRTAVLAAWEAFNRGDIEEMLQYMDPELEWHEAEHLFDRGVYRGHEGLRRLIRENEETFGGGLRGDLDEVFEAGEDLMVAMGHFNGGIGGIQVRIRFVHVCRLREGRLLHLQEYEDLGSVTNAITALGRAGGAPASP